MVALQFLVLSVVVRVRLGQQKREAFRGLPFSVYCRQTTYIHGVQKTGKRLSSIHIKALSHLFCQELEKRRSAKGNYSNAKAVTLSLILDYTFIM